jgi:hypothetical protein|tara:strand:- start:273 stop:512 length:240 start_codon:yes stop_codon:yes gene_type:complete
MNELEIIQKLDQIISDLVKDGLLDIANNLEIEKQKIAKQFNQAEANSQQIDIEDLIEEDHDDTFDTTDPYHPLYLDNNQ